MPKEIQTRINSLKIYGQSLSGAKVYFREDRRTNYFDLCGKQFGMMSKEPDETAIITLKHALEKNEELRELYPGVIVLGYYANKKHWNSIKLSSRELTDTEIQEMIKISFELVYKKLPKKNKEELSEGINE